MQKHTPKIGIISLGCAKALVDSERLITKLYALGYEITNTSEEADLIIINTCGFINEAIDESLATIDEALKTTGKVIVTGCLGKRKQLILEKFPQVLLATGPEAYQEIISKLQLLLPCNDEKSIFMPKQGIKLTPPHYAYLKISEGCNNRCSFCIIPKLRGPLTSRPISEILTEAENLVKAGVKELLIISQDTSAYGIDLKETKTDLYQLCSTLSKFGIWIRLHYLFPYPNLDKIMFLMAEKKILPYLDIPLQHANPRILKLMQRPANMENTLDKINSWRKFCPDLTIRSTFIVGFPGETKQEFAELLTFLEEAQLNRVGCFKYSAVHGAAANQLPNHIPEEVKAERLQQLMQLQANISATKLKHKIGTTISVIVDEVGPEYAIARSMGDTPEVDGVIIIAPSNNIQTGALVSVKINRSNEHDLFGTIA